MLLNRGSTVLVVPYQPVYSYISLVCVGQPPVPKGNGIDVDPRARVAGGHGEPGLKVASIKGCQLFHEGDDDDPTVGHHVGNLRVELDVVDLDNKM